MNTFLAEHPELHPVWFAEKELGLTLNNKQIAILDNIASNKKTAIKACNGAGKTTRILAVGVLWAMSKFPGCRNPITSGSWTQLETQIQPAIEMHKPKLPKGWKFNSKNIEAPNGSTAVYISTKEPGRFEGNHGEEIEGPLFGWVDEAKSVPDPILNTIDRWTYQRLTMMSSTGDMMGGFFDAFDKPELGFDTFSIDINDCTHLDIEERKRTFFTKYGENHPLTRSALFAEFMGDDELAAAAKPIKQQHLAVCMKHGAHLITRTDRAAFCDFARGRAENVFCLREGNTIKVLIAWKESDSNAAATRFLQLFKDHDLRPEQVWGDSDGLGGPIIDAMAATGFRINEFHGGVHSKNQDYLNLIAEAWYELGKAIERREVTLPEDVDGVLRRQLINRYGILNPQTRKLKLESKEDMSERGVVSPDRADAVAGAWWAQEVTPRSWLSGRVHRTPDVAIPNFQKPKPASSSKLAGALRY